MLQRSSLRDAIAQLRSPAPFWSLRYHHEKRELHAMRQDTLEPPRVSLDRGVMLTAVTPGGYGYCATSDVSVAGLQTALERATDWAQATQGASVVRFDPEKMPAPRGEYESPSAQPPPERAALHELLAAECKAAKIDERIVERYASLELVEDERVYLTNTGGELRQRFRYTLPYVRVTANEGAETQSRSLGESQQGGFEHVERAGFVEAGGGSPTTRCSFCSRPNVLPAGWISCSCPTR